RRLGDFGGAAEYFEKASITLERLVSHPASELEPRLALIAARKLAEAQGDAGTAYNYMGEDPDAMEAFNHVLHIASDDRWAVNDGAMALIRARAIVAKANKLCDRGDTAGALVLYDQIIEIIRNQMVAQKTEDDPEYKVLRESALILGRTYSEK